MRLPDIFENLKTLSSMLESWANDEGYEVSWGEDCERHFNLIFSKGMHACIINIVPAMAYNIHNSFETIVDHVIMEFHKTSNYESELSNFVSDVTMKDIEKALRNAVKKIDNIFSEMYGSNEDSGTDKP